MSSSSGMVRVTTVDEDHQEVVLDEPSPGEFFGFASMLDETAHQSGATALQETVCIEVDRHDIAILLQRKPMAGMDMLTVLGRQFSCFAETGARACRPQSERNHRRERDLRRAHRRPRRQLWLLDLYHLVPGRAGQLCNSQRRSATAVMGSLPVYPVEPVSIHAGGDSGADHHDEVRTGRTKKTGCGVNWTSKSTAALKPKFKVLRTRSI